ncbi:Dihydroorotate dehydrogenase (quinone) [Candidatus Xenohaliotis californiensis]|uniref:Dihydroorotate dehydrogenase (quinone) n=1 Tax=Candidatus Xenohaliotis californiensis TaxID=84677 RepID=A0ABM9N965_9RICK|nr:Dihydroorotate dehydrogenase (quinone) [Candidatus Xenohaliotis californiensis]
MEKYKIIRPLVFSFPPEIAHNIAIKTLKYLPKQKSCSNSVLENNLFGLKFKTPVGIAAGFDKNGEVVEALFNQGLSFVEVGTVTPFAQKGNAKPRIFRLLEDEAIINSMGFNNKGIDYVISRLSVVPKNKGIVGINIGKNKLGSINDFSTCLEQAYATADYIAINISSPNTFGLRNLQGRNELKELLDLITEKKRELIKKFQTTKPLLIKISPDNDYKTMEGIAELSLTYNIDGLIISNTTIQREKNLLSPYKSKPGGLSGKPLTRKTNESIKTMYKLLNGTKPIIGSGGIVNANDAYEKIKLGASLIQLYTGIIYNGFSIVTKIQHNLVKLLHNDGFSNIKDAVGQGNN